MSLTSELLLCNLYCFLSCLRPPTCTYMPCTCTQPNEWADVYKESQNAVLVRPPRLNLSENN